MPGRRVLTSIAADDPVDDMPRRARRAAIGRRFHRAVSIRGELVRHP
jgi:hypothetical protein